MRFDNELMKQGIETVNSVVENSYSIGDFTFEVEGDIRISVLDKVRLLSQFADIASNQDKELEFGISLINKYLDNKTLRFFKDGEQIGTPIIYSAKDGFDVFPIFSQYPILVQSMSSRMIGFISKNSLGCLIKAEDKQPKKAKAQ